MHFLKEIYQLFLPEICACCDKPLVKNEIDICLRCRISLPLTYFADEPGNRVEQVFYGSAAIEFATSLLFYRPKGKTQRLIYQLKYKGNQNLGLFFGCWLADQLVTCQRFPMIDFVVPVPLHPRKQKKRGYNQLSTFGGALATTIAASFIEGILIRKSSNTSQTDKQRFDRWKNVQEIFYLNDLDFFRGKHILLIDDVITTGATLEACAKTLSQTKDIKISIASIAFTE